MDFFQAQDEARKKTGWLLFAFLFCVVGVVVSIALLSWGLSILIGENLPLPFTASIGAGVGGLILLASGFKALQLRGGGGVVARDLGGRLVDPSTTETHERRLLNVVEEMAIASGVPVPQVYVMDEEGDINAFAAGTEPGNAAIGVTRGCLTLLNRAELQGVIAHEFSHILNGDMKLNMRLIGWIFGLVVLTIMGRGILHSLRFVRVNGSNREGNSTGAILLAILAVGLGLLVIGGIGTFFARVLQAAVSRQREFLADASAVQFTREPEGLAGALKKIGGAGSKIQSAKAAEASHCFFANGGLFAFGFATHPPLEVRIRRLQKDWDGHFSASSLAPIAARESSPSRERDARLAGFADASRLGDSARVHLAQGHRLREELPREWQEAVHHREEAQALVFGLLLAEDQALRAEEVATLREKAGPDAAELALRWQGALGEAHSANKIALIDLAVPTLRNLSRPEYERFVGLSRDLIASDGRVDIFEFMLQRLIEHHLAGHFAHRGSPRIRYHQISDLSSEAELLLSAFAHLNPEPAQAFEQGWRELALASGQLRPAGEIDLSKINRHLERFEEASPLLKRTFLQACTRTVASDGQLSSREAELLRAMADSIGCPLAPWVEELEHGER
ncbi:M48 family metallopeptidase [Roseibacillus ishigakijimensis]|uniref:M48 family metallopeptidase n=1 Tax=Roseibacillus ishigakijimensis TaxID=454146 RepID=A0A934RMN8_9BACT|nr:M48 family metallopeptidase [Roseibacillus ishigakijimensis]MBK1833633.1 M48 family metallopeptidase [Roseibacillus ishigakijimensis]